MARDNQRLQVGLIICIMAIVILAAVSFFGWRAANEYGGQLEARQQELTRARQELTAASSSNQYLLAMLGSGGSSMEALEAGGLTLSDELKAVKQKFDTDMQQLAQGLPSTEKNYPAVAHSLFTEIQALNRQLADANDRINQVLAERNQKVQELTQRVEAAEQGQEKAGADLLAVKQQFDQERQNFLTKEQALNEQLKTLQEEREKAIQTAQQQQQSSSQTITELENRITQLNEKFENIHKESFERPHGRVVSVNQLDRTVWINLGTADGLRPQVSFSLYPEGTTGVEKANPKARLEVTRVFDQHLSEARIVEDKLADPVMRGDVVYSPAWRPAMKVRFALAGFMDINDDGQSDRELIRNVITMNGGVIDAELHDDGTMTGQLDVGTRFLVLGNRPTEREKPEAVKAFSELTSAAQRYGVEQIKVGELLNLMGWKPELRTVDLGGASGASNEASGFRPRRPPTPSAPMPRGDDDSAF